jgi:hypothetical protein
MNERENQHTQQIRDIGQQGRYLNLHPIYGRANHHYLRVSDSKGMKEMKKLQKLFFPVFLLYLLPSLLDHFHPAENPARTSPSDLVSFRSICSLHCKHYKLNREYILCAKQQKGVPTLPSYKFFESVKVIA